MKGYREGEFLEGVSVARNGHGWNGFRNYPDSGFSYY
jgi:hypothetical protein